MASISRFFGPSKDKPVAYTAHTSGSPLMKNSSISKRTKKCSGKGLGSELCLYNMTSGFCVASQTKSQDQRKSDREHCICFVIYRLRVG